MKIEKSFCIRYGVFMLALLIFLPGIQGFKLETTSYTGVIERTDKNLKFIVVNHARIPISGNVQIVDENANILKAEVLRPKVSVVIEGFHGPEGFLANKIIVTKPKQKP